MDKNNFNITENIKIEFTKIKQTRNKIKDKFIQIQKVQNSIKENYVSYLKKEQSDFFGLDSFHFQNKVLELEFNNMMKLYQFIDNRIYGDYYKLFSEIETFLRSKLKPKQYDKVKEFKNLEKYPVYRDLDKFKTYEFDLIHNIHQDIIVTISFVKDIYKENEKIIKDDVEHLNVGLNIDNYIINSQYKNLVIISTNKKFENYLKVYHKYHYNLLHKFYEKLSLCYQHINHNPRDERFNPDSSDSSLDGTTPRHKNEFFLRGAFDKSHDEEQNNENKINREIENITEENSIQVIKKHSISYDDSDGEISDHEIEYSKNNEENNEEHIEENNFDDMNQFEEPQQIRETINSNEPEQSFNMDNVNDMDNSINLDTFNSTDDMNNSIHEQNEEEDFMNVSNSNSKNRKKRNRKKKK